MYEEYYGAFRRSPLCKDMEPSEYEVFLQKLDPVIKTYKKDEYIVKEGDSIASVMMILQGQVLMTRTMPTGEKAIYEIMREGHAFGEIIIMLANRPFWTSDYIAKTDCTVLVLWRQNIEKALLDPTVFTNRIYYNWVATICRYVENTMIALRCLRRTTVRQKISTYLYEMYLLNNETQFVLPFNRSEMAAYLFMPQSSLSREMSKMKSEGIIDYYKSTIKILDLEALANN